MRKDLKILVTFFIDRPPEICVRKCHRLVVGCLGGVICISIFWFQFRLLGCAYYRSSFTSLIAMQSFKTVIPEMARELIEVREYHA